ncbi:MAG TPA: gluconokinase [Candidatus Binatia bacterium]
MVVIILGVAGAGKTTVGALLARELGWRFHDADTLHPAANVDKMRRGEPLGDADRAPWLAAVRAIIENALARGEHAVVACSALKESYRAILRAGPGVLFVYLKIDPALAKERLARRTGHFMNPILMQSQFDALEEPPSALVVDASAPPAAIIKTIRDSLKI